jgi:hypothetical protein
MSTKNLRIHNELIFRHMRYCLHSAFLVLLGLFYFWHPHACLFKVYDEELVCFS